MRSTTLRIPLNVPALLEHAALLHRATEIVSILGDGSGYCCTYADVHRRARALAQALERAHLGAGDRVGTLMWNHHVHLEIHFGVPAMGGVLVPINVRLHPADIAYVIEHSQIRFLLIDDTLLSLYEEIRRQIGDHRIVVFSASGARVKNHESYEEFLQKGTVDHRQPDLDELQPASMCYTSGTTGRPKGVVYSHRALVLHSLIAALPDVLGICQQDVVLPIAPMFHVHAWTLPFVATMVGAKQVLPGSQTEPRRLLDICEAQKVTFAAAVPTVWLRVLDQLDANPRRWDLSRKLRIMMGGSAPPSALLAGLRRHGIAVFQAWGMTETAAAATVSRLSPDLEKGPEEDKLVALAKQGQPVPLLQLRVMRDQQEMPWDGRSAGELQVRAPWVSGGYYESGEESGTASSGGWCRTGDIVTIDSSGCVTLLDRTKDLIKSGGEWISSVALENALMDHFAVADAVVVGVPHPKWQERPLAVVVPRPAFRVTVEDLKVFLEPKFARWWLPDAILFAEAIPRTSAGKADRDRLREQYGSWYSRAGQPTDDQ